jgi:pseudouridine synthase
MGERLQKALASAGLASRRRAEEMIAAGEVRVNGELARVGQVVDTRTDRIEVGGRPLPTRTQKVYLALNKPLGFVTSLRSTHGENTVAGLIPLSERVFPVGRLDRETSGLLLFTNDGDWANVVTHPRFGVQKEYRVLVRGHPSASTLDGLRAGVTLPGGGRTAPARVELLGREGANTRLSVTVIEGKKRQIRVMLEAAGHPVVSLGRVRVGPVLLHTLQPGSWRALTKAEVEGIRAHGRRAAAGAGVSRQAADRD